MVIDGKLFHPDITNFANIFTTTCTLLLFKEILRNFARGPIWQQRIAVVLSNKLTQSAVPSNKLELTLFSTS